jgi:hypothetical protein
MTTTDHANGLPSVPALYPARVEVDYSASYDRVKNRSGSC